MRPANAADRPPSDGYRNVATVSFALERRVARLERTARRVVSVLVFGILLIAGAVMRADDVVLGSVLMIASVVPLLFALFAGRRPR